VENIIVCGERWKLYYVFVPLSFVLSGIATAAYYDYTQDFWQGVGAVYIGVLVGLIAFFNFVIFPSCTITVTDKRIHGKVRFGKRIDLPLDLVSSVSIGQFRTIGVATSSGVISFSLVKNAQEVHSEINKLLIERQSKNNAHTPQQQAYTAQPQSMTYSVNTDELKQLKELLDTGVITQEEFDTKKKQLLGI
jgi:hypothetical protein